MLRSYDDPLLFVSKRRISQAYVSFTSHFGYPSVVIGFVGSITDTVHVSFQAVIRAVRFSWYIEQVTRFETTRTRLTIFLSATTQLESRNKDKSIFLFNACICVCFI